MICPIHALGKGWYAVRMSTEKPIKIKPQQVMAALERRWRLARAAGDMAQMDRRPTLAALAAELGCSEEMVLKRGFERMYRQLVEGV